MAIQDDLIAMMREDLGPAFEKATIAALLKEVAKRVYAPRLKALYAARLDNAALLAQRQSAEEAARQAQVDMESARAAAMTQAETDLAGV